MSNCSPAWKWHGTPRRFSRKIPAARPSGGKNGSAQARSRAAAYADEAPDEAAAALRLQQPEQRAQATCKRREGLACPGAQALLDRIDLPMRPGEPRQYVNRKTTAQRASRRMAAAGRVARMSA